MSIGSLSGQSLSQLYSSIYSKMDADGSSSVSKDELTQALSAKSGTGSASTTQADAASKLFSAMDSDSDGALTSSEMTSYFQNNLSVSTLSGLLDTQSSGGVRGKGESRGGPPSLSDIDSDGDGAISKTEMETFSTSKMGDTDTTKADQLFSAMDANADGSVSADEKTSFDSQMAAQRPSGPPPAGGGQAPQSASASGSSSESSSTTDPADTNGDGTVSLAELTAYAAKQGDDDTSKISDLFSKIDSNGDGGITTDEKSAFDEKMAAEGPQGPRGAGGPPPGPPPSDQASATTSTDSTTTTDSGDAIKQLTAQWLQSLYASLSDGASSLTSSATSGSTLSISA